MNYKLDFVKHRKWFMLSSAVFLVAGLLSLMFQGLNLGVDFVSGTRVDVNIGQAYNLEVAKDYLEELGYNSPDARKAGTNDDILVFRTSQVLSPDEVGEIEKKFQAEYNKNVGVNEQKVDPVIGRELARNAIISVLLAALAIILYITIRFEYRFGVSAVIALLHDALFVIGMFSIFQWEVDLVFIAAILTIVGYSINDTIVIYDRIRENMNFNKPKTWDELKKTVNDSIGQVLVRSLSTSFTTVFAATALFIFGGESIRYFSLALLMGLAAGTYSSIFIASQIWITWKWRSMAKEKMKAQTAE
ncbi:preprotein translocase subunit SecF [Melghirimyces thermohalophilus]|uniref:Protein-export membrane protein SecF n=1 Tax=Melghirimyces thermohalophilus TaxID=1236220 RepID=A0A1G6JIE8_9BACL|nr:protein translocase subunit SecF [Melghirimyces thermohalophilus]SDC18493.1 preprotein translocase subunit SecF [Melghirimyces thermohalophilus]